MHTSVFKKKILHTLLAASAFAAFLWPGINGAVAPTATSAAESASTSPVIEALPNNATPSEPLRIEETPVGTNESPAPAPAQEKPPLPLAYDYQLTIPAVGVDAPVLGMGNTAEGKMAARIFPLITRLTIRSRKY